MWEGVYCEKDCGRGGPVYCGMRVCGRVCTVKRIVGGRLLWNERGRVCTVKRIVGGRLLWNECGRAFTVE